MKGQIKEVLENQDHILEAIKILNERVGVIEDKSVDEKLENPDNILRSQAMIDGIIVKNSDEIVLIKKTRPMQFWKFIMILGKA